MRCSPGSATSRPRWGPGSGADFTAEARFGVEWLLRMWDDTSGTLYYQVGIGSGNRQDDQRPRHLAPAPGRRRLRRRRPPLPLHPPPSRLPRRTRPDRRSARTSPAATPPPSRSASRIFRSSDPSLAERCLRAGEHIFELANTHPRRHLLTTIPFSFYPEREWRDDLELGATELADALSSTLDPPRRPAPRPVLLLPGPGGELGKRLHQPRQAQLGFAEPL